MALGGTSIGWDETNPADSRNLGLGAGDIRSIQSNVRGALDSEHVFGSSSGTAGAHRLGSGRVFVGVSSQVSSVDTDGRLMWTSDTNQLWYLSSATTKAINSSLGTGTANSLAVWTSASAQSSSGLFDLNGPSAGVPYCVTPTMATFTRSAAFPVNSTTTTIVFDTSTVQGGFGASTTTRAMIPSAYTGLYYLQYQGYVDNSGAPTAVATITVFKNALSVLSGSHGFDSGAGRAMDGSSMVTASSKDSLSITLQNSGSTATFSLALKVVKVW